MRLRLVHGQSSAGNFSLQASMPPRGSGSGSGNGDGDGSGGTMSIFAATSGWATDSVDATDNGFIVLSIYNLPPEATVDWSIALDGDEFHVASCLTDRSILLNGPHNRPVIVTASATVNGTSVPEIVLTLSSNAAECP